MTIFDDLRASHAVQRSLARTMTHARASADTRRAAFLALAHELDAHATAEERHFYVPLLMDDAGLSVSRHALADHHKAEELVEQLRGVDPTTDGFTELASAALRRGARPPGRRGARHLPAGREAVVEVAPDRARPRLPGRIREPRRTLVDVRPVTTFRSYLGGTTQRSRGCRCALPHPLTCSTTRAATATWRHGGARCSTCTPTDRCTGSRPRDSRRSGR